MTPAAGSAYRGRFAPSPTGLMHLGLARTALLTFLRARAERGTLVLRIEDLDTPRVVRGASDALLQDLRWLGLEWEEGPDRAGPYGPYVQSQRFNRYEQVIEQLRARGLIYPCTCSRKEIALASAPHGEAEFGAVYPGTCRAGPSRPGAPAALRFRTPDTLPSFVDQRSKQRVAPVAQGDFVVRRADGLFSYQLAVVVDDIDMQISEVVRGDDLAGCTGWQLALYQALDAEPPSFAHVPLLLDGEGKRLAKRDDATSLRALREAGVSAEEVIGYLAASLGMVEEGCALRAHELVGDFRLEQLREVQVRPLRSDV